ncbi:TonB-dependent receptor [Lysobacter sp. LF1]|uniref:TonB-dependent receptor n=1 Tax=Lysobacter stagni TaxID=3045172 RepID=A0ABT6XGX8_9GAMM|nr:TonB-dependent receptor [Lysobacter sp. LF1]MDI9239413.1 TonB-dependent receptor [Lysobacter sp. LF1]
MKRSTLNRNMRRSALTVALGLCFASGVHAQQTGGSVFGQATAGETVVIENSATGFRREVAVGADGAFRVPALSPGNYRVTLQRADGTTTVRDGVAVSLGTGTPVSFGASASSGSATTLESVVVTGAQVVNPIDVSSVESTTILTAAQIAKIPVARDATSVALLAPGTVRGDNAFGNLASFGGSSVAENQYYLNGFNITNSFRGLNFAQVPYEAIAEQQVKTGGYGAEFGRSLGGVVNMISKRGTNEFHAGGNVFWSPKSLRSEVASTYYANPLADNDINPVGSVREDNSEDTEEQWNSSIWASGALIKDTLFAYGLLSYSQKEQNYWNTQGNTYFPNNNFHEKEKGNPTWLVKLDWNISDNHLLEFTSFSDQRDTTRQTYLNGASPLSRGGLVGTSYEESGGDNYVAKYTGYLTDTFTLSALYGYGEYSRSRHLITAGGQRVEYGGDLNQPATGCPIITDIRPGYRKAVTGTYASTCNITGGAIPRSDSGDTRDMFRIDAEWQLGDHRVRGGIDVDEYESVAGNSNEGGRLWRYSTTDRDGDPNSGDEFDVVREQIVNQGSTVKVKSQAYYLEDYWSISDTFLAYIGARWDTFENYNGEGQKYVEIKNQFAPRLGFSWDVHGDSTFKVYGNAGRYALPLTSSVAVRGASASLFTRQNFDFSGVDPVTGAPINPTPRGGLTYVNGEFGEPKTPETIASQNLDPMYQDEFILGFQYQLTDHQNVGARGIYRKLKAAIDDNCDYTPILTIEGFSKNDDDVWVDANGREAALPSAGFPYCRMFNPGSDAVFLTDLYGDGNLKATTVPGDLLSPKAKRNYQALELFWDGSWDKWFFQASYTLARNKGNTEGGVKSDIGQADTNVTQDFDYKELAVDSYGYLPNDRRHSLKVFGNYSFNDEWSVGANLLVQSGRPINCFGVLPVGDVADGDLHGYGASFFRCGTTSAGGGYLDTNNDLVPDTLAPAGPAPRGTAGRLPWTNSIDLNIAYFPNWAKGLQFKVDVFNVFDNQKVTSVSEVAEDAVAGAPLDTYLIARTFQAPRAVRFMVQYDF